MAKVKMMIGYQPYIMDESAAFALFKAMNGASIEKLESSYNSETKSSTYYVQPMENGMITISSVSNEDYAVWKLAGASR